MTCVCFSFAFNLDLLRRVEKFNSIGKMWPTYNLLLGKYFLTRMPPALMDNRPCVKCFTYMKIFCFPSDFDKTWWCCSTHGRVLQHLQVSSKFDEKKNSFTYNTFNAWSVHWWQVNLALKWIFVFHIHYDRGDVSCSIVHNVGRYAGGNALFLSTLRYLSIFQAFLHLQKNLSSFLHIYLAHSVFTGSNNPKNKMC